MLGREPSNTQEFRCFQISQATRMTSEFRPLRKSFGAALISLPHQAEKVEESASISRYIHHQVQMREHQRPDLSCENT